MIELYVMNAKEDPIAIVHVCEEFNGSSQDPYKLAYLLLMSNED